MKRDLDLTRGIEHFSSPENDSTILHDIMQGAKNINKKNRQIHLPEIIKSIDANISVEPFIINSDNQPAKVVIIGDQSAGKTSMLQGISMITGADTRVGVISPVKGTKFVTVLKYTKNPAHTKISFVDKDESRWEDFTNHPQESLYKRLDELYNKHRNNLPNLVNIQLSINVYSPNMKCDVVFYDTPGMNINEQANIKYIIGKLLNTGNNLVFLIHDMRKDPDTSIIYKFVKGRVLPRKTNNVVCIGTHVDCSGANDAYHAYKSQIEKDLKSKMLFCIPQRDGKLFPHDKEKIKLQKRGFVGGIQIVYDMVNDKVIDANIRNNAAHKQFCNNLLTHCRSVIYAINTIDQHKDTIVIGHKKAQIELMTSTDGGSVIFKPNMVINFNEKSSSDMIKADSSKYIGTLALTVVIS